MNKIKCVLCNSNNLKIQNVGPEGFTVARCLNCNYAFNIMEAGKKDTDYSKKYYESWGLNEEENLPASTELMKKRTFLDKLIRIEKYIKPGKVLDIGCANGNFLEVAKKRGWEVSGTEISDYSAGKAKEKLGDCICREDFMKKDFLKQKFDLVTMLDVIEHFEDPVSVLKKAHGILNKEGLLLIVTPSLDSWSSRIMGRKWINFKKEHLVYFSQSSIKNMLTKLGFYVLETKANTKFLNLGYIQSQLEVYKVPLVSALFKRAGKFVPKKLKDMNFRLYTGELMLIARKVEQ